MPTTNQSKDPRKVENCCNHKTDKGRYESTAVPKDHSCCMFKHQLGEWDSFSDGPVKEAHEDSKDKKDDGSNILTNVYIVCSCEGSNDDHTDVTHMDHEPRHKKHESEPNYRHHHSSQAGETDNSAELCSTDIDEW